MTAVTRDESALEERGSGHGLFTAAISRGLTGNVFDANDKDEVTSMELFTYVQRHVVETSGGLMTPQRKPILLRHFDEDCNGDMLFFRPPPQHPG